MREAGLGGAAAGDVARSGLLDELILERRSIAALFFRGFVGMRICGRRGFAETAGPRLLVIEKGDDLRGDGILLFARKTRHPAQGFLQPLRHVSMIMQRRGAG